MPKSARDCKAMGVNMPLTLLEELDATCERLAYRRPEAIRQAIRDFIEKHSEESISSRYRFRASVQRRRNETD